MTTEESLVHPSFPRWADSDYIVVCKECPTAWLTKAREVYPWERLIVATGGAGEVGRKIATLPPPQPH